MEKGILEMRHYYLKDILNSFGMENPINIFI